MRMPVPLLSKRLFNTLTSLMSSAAPFWI